MTIEQTEQIADNLATKLEPVCMEVLNQGAGFVATEALYSIIAVGVLMIICFISSRLALNIKNREIRELAVGLILISAFISVFGFFLTFSRNIAIIQYPMGYLLLEILK